MKFCINKAGEAFAFEDDGSQDSYIKPDMVLMTAAEVDAHINPPLTAADLVAQHNAPILAKMNDLDLNRIRPLAEGDTVYLAALNQKIVTLRATLK